MVDYVIIEDCKCMPILGYFVAAMEHFLCSATLM